MELACPHCSNILCGLFTKGFSDDLGRKCLPSPALSQQRLQVSLLSLSTRQDLSDQDPVLVTPFLLSRIFIRHWDSDWGEAVAKMTLNPGLSFPRVSHRSLD